MLSKVNSRAGVLSVCLCFFTRLVDRHIFVCLCLFISTSVILELLLLFFRVCFFFWTGALGLHPNTEVFCRGDLEQC